MNRKVKNLIIILFIILFIITGIFFVYQNKSMIKYKIISILNPPSEINENIENEDTNYSEPVISTLTGIKWSWERITTSENEIIFPRTHDAFTITFTEDGEIDGTTDCNNFSSTFTKNESNINFGPFMSTEMYCKNSQEEIFKKLLSEVNNFSVYEDSKLILNSEKSSITFVNKDSEENKRNWNLIKEAVANCNIKKGGQTHSREVTVKLKNGEELKAYSPKIDNIFDIVNDAEEKCGKVILWTE